MTNLDYRFFYRRHLPHIQPPGATLFITFRLAGSIPARVIRQLAEEARNNDSILARISDLKERARLADISRRTLFGKWDEALDTNEGGPLWLGDERVAKLLAESLHHRNGQVYDLVAFCIMPNHVHLVCTPLPKSKGSFYSLASTMHSLKLYVARRANIMLERNGDFWQHENYDHVIRDDDELCRIVEYVLNNPVLANLVKNRKGWKWSFSKYERAN